MGKILLLVLLAFVAYAFWRAAQAKSRSAADREGKEASRGEAGESRAVEKMVRCERCGVHLPVGEAYLSDGRHYCSEEHARVERR